MARTPNTPAQPITPIEVLPALAQRYADTQDALTLAASQYDASVRSMAASMGYELPADCTDPDLIQRDIAANMRRSVEACLQVGMGLRVLKEACEHGQFMARLDVLGIEGSVARRFMDAATRFPKRATSHVLKAIGNQSKLFEMLVLDDSQLEELELTGNTGELSLDDVAGMSVKELRKALRDSRQEKQAVEKVLERKNKEIDKLQLVQVLPADELAEQVHAKAQAVMLDALGAVRGGLRAALVAINDLPDAPSKAVWMAGLVGQLQAELGALRDEFNLPDVSNAKDAQLLAEMAQWAN